MDNNAEALKAAMNSAIEDTTSLPSDIVEGDDLNQAVMDMIQQGGGGAQVASDAKYENMTNEGGKKLTDAAGKAAGGALSLVDMILKIIDAAT